MAKARKTTAIADPEALVPDRLDTDRLDTDPLTTPTAQIARARKKPSGGKRTAGQLALTMPLARARRLAGDLYEAAGLAIWTEALERADEAAREEILALQEAVCEAADLFKEARSTNPHRLSLYLVACYDRDGLPDTPPHFVTAASGEDAIKLWKLANRDKFGRRKPRAQKVPPRGDKPLLHD